MLTNAEVFDWVNSAVIVGVGVYLAKSFLNFKDKMFEEIGKVKEDLVKAITELKTEMIGVNGSGGMKREIELLSDFKYRISNLEGRVEHIEEKIRDHETRLRFSERPKNA